jgi:hypothetical protein
VPEPILPVLGQRPNVDVLLRRWVLLEPVRLGDTAELWRPRRRRVGQHGSILPELEGAVVVELACHDVVAHDITHHVPNHIPDHVTDHVTDHITNIVTNSIPDIVTLSKPFRIPDVVTDAVADREPDYVAYDITHHVLCTITHHVPYNFNRHVPYDIADVDADRRRNALWRFTF